MTSAEYAVRYLLHRCPELRKAKYREGLGSFVYGQELDRLRAWQVPEEKAKEQARANADDARQYLRDLAKTIEADNESETGEYDPAGEAVAAQMERDLLSDESESQ